MASIDASIPFNVIIPVGLSSKLSNEFKIEQFDDFKKFLVPADVTGFSKFAAAVSALVNRIVQFIFQGKWINSAELGKKINEYRFTLKFSEEEETKLRESFESILGRGKYEALFDAAMEEAWYDKVRNTFSFMGEFFKAPLTVGAIIPSSSNLARRVSKHVTPSAEGEERKNYLEAGPGTGEFTLQMVKKLGRNDRLDLVEYDEKFCKILRQRFGHLKNVHINHCSILDWKPAEYKYDAIVSGIPLGVFSSEMVEKVYRQFEDVMAEGGVLSYFEYPVLPNVKKLFVSDEEKKDIEKMWEIKNQFVSKHQGTSEIEWWNLPPARVVSCKIGTKETTLEASEEKPFEGNLEIQATA